ncbi:SRPBCC family protein [Streptomyces sp. NBC_00820]|uniref:SRPBCC family protein n=1 Tax=Streptomyces sp. NBC_00820 TaxID=2975842 RepID=UPI002ED1583E|nr:SRPBCC family protein [Streptomyces sp. NBC_00820]
MTLRAVGPARPDTVWRRYTCLDQWASWSPQIRAVHADRREVSPGLSGTVQTFAGIRIAFLVEDVDEEERSWTWRVRLGPARLRLRHDVRAHAEGSETSLVLQGPAPLLAAYAPLARLALHRLVQP